jgi:subtilisin family serine protease
MSYQGRSILIHGHLPEGAALKVASRTFGLTGSKIPLTTRPLFGSIGAGAPGLAAAPAWHVVTADALDEVHAWDACHAAVGQGFGIAGTGAQFAEPDIPQRWIFGDDAQQALAMTSGCASQDPDPAFPPNPFGDDPYWIRDASHAEFRGDPNDGAGICVAHLDTGFDPQHDTRPAHLRAELQRNFVDPQFPLDATDRTVSGLLTNLGHGTGTIGILAGAGINGGAPIGAAPGASVIPVRVANGVVLFKNSTIAQGFDYVHGLLSDPATRVHVVTLSMGGLASQAWADAVNALYEAGVFIVAAAGNNHGNWPTRNIAYPARFKRVVAACGVMADGKPYADLPDAKLMAGNYGPPSKMETALAAYTPNTPWARIGCKSVVNRHGAGTSSSTPQIAAAAAVYYQKYQASLDDRAQYPEPWMRVEAVRAALFAAAKNTDPVHFGHGTLRAADALAIAPPASDTLPKQPPDDASFELLRILTGLGVTASSPRNRMLGLEALQLSQSAAIEALLPDPERPPQSRREQLAIVDALAADPRASQTLRAKLAELGAGRIHPVETPPSAASPPPPPSSPPQPARATATTPTTPVPAGASAMDVFHLQHATAPQVHPPARRRLRVYAYDPSLEVQLETYAINQALVDVRWEKLEPGPVGEYIEVVDVDPSSRCAYAPVDLDDPYLLVQNGRSPAESDAQFHQQMVYAVSMKTIEHFEHALGRVALWAPRAIGYAGSYRTEYVQRLRIYPHALREANAFYSPDKKALLLGYFPAPPKNAGVNAPGALVFGALSYDIVAHETTHALLDGLHRRFSEPTNPDVLALHEGFADIVALFQHFSVPEALRDQIAKTRGDLSSQDNLLSKLAYQFGQAQKGHGALRDALGKYDENGVWVPSKPTGNEYANATEPHDRGSVLVAAVFDAFLRIYRIRSADLIRLASSGTGVLPPGNIPHDLVERLAQEASKVAKQWLDICIRALDYCPPVDPTFGDYLRALITADRDLVPEDTRSYRIAFLSAFRDRGIYAQGVRYLAERSLAWEPPPRPLVSLKNVLAKMTLNWDLDSDRRQAYDTSNVNGAVLHDWLMSDDVSGDELQMLGLYRGKQENFKIAGIAGTLGGIEVHSVRPARRIAPDDQTRAQLIVEITQTWRSPGYNSFRGGVTLIVDLVACEVRYVVRKSVTSVDRFNAQQGITPFGGGQALQGEATSLHDNYYDSANTLREPFAMLHRSSATTVRL